MFINNIFKMSSTDNIAIAFVLFNPEENELIHIQRIANIYKGSIVDNSSQSNFSGNTVGKMSYISLHKNTGIAKAQNIAIKIILLDHTIEHIIFFDQDSCFGENYPKQILNEFVQIKKTYPNLAILGPTIINKDNKKEYKSIIHKDIKGNNGFIFKKEIISSGSCVCKETFYDVGFFEEKLFIDFVDCEWCFRAISKGYLCGITSHLKIEHQVGKNQKNLGGHTIIFSAPPRYYYQYRNFLILLTRNYTPLAFKLGKGTKFLLRLIYFPFIKGGFQRWKYMWKGIFAWFKLKL